MDIMNQWLMASSENCKAEKAFEEFKQRISKVYAVPDDYKVYTEPDEFFNLDKTLIWLDPDFRRAVDAVKERYAT